MVGRQNSRIFGKVAIYRSGISVLQKAFFYSASLRARYQLRDSRALKLTLQIQN